VGQRRGINCPAPEPYYVVRIDPGENRLVVGGRDDLYASGCRVTGINWIADAPRQPLRCRVKIRYRHRAVACRLDTLGSRVARVCFETPQAAVTPGQGAVFYTGDEVLGGGWIESTDDTVAEEQHDR
jgi:tRNA-specific 2-thiouridylase